MRVSIHQPNLFPRLKTLSKIANSDIFVILDNVQYVRNEYQNRTKFRHFKNPEQEYWLTLPIKKTKTRNTNINEILCTEVNKKNFFQSLEITYHSSPYFNEICQYVDKVFKINSDYLVDYSSASMIEILRILSPKITFHFSSNLVHQSDFGKMEKNEKLIYICRQLSCKTYLCGTGGANYLNDVLFDTYGIQVEHQKWNSQKISQKYANLNWDSCSFIDFWARYGFKELRTFINKEKLKEDYYVTN